jgi:hypothetical protein
MKKIWMIIAGTVLVLVAGILVYLKTRKLDDFEPLVKRKLAALVSDASDSLYRLQFDKIEIDVLASRILLVNARLRHDSLVYRKLQAQHKAPESVYEISLGSLGIDGLSAADILSRKDIRLNVLYIDRPQIRIIRKLDKPDQPGSDSLTLYQRIHKAIGSFGITKLVIRQADLVLADEVKKQEQSFRQVNIAFDDLLIDSTTQYDTTRFLYGKDARISLAALDYRLGDSLHRLQADSIEIAAAKKIVTIHRFRLQPRVSKQQFRKVIASRRDRYDITVPRITLEGVDWWNMVQGNAVNATSITLAGGKAEVYSDRSVPAISKVGLYPQQSLFELPMPVYIQQLVVNNLDIVYSEFNPDSQQEGHARFLAASGTARNITNRPDRVAANPLLTIDATARFMGAGQLKARFVFDLARQKEGIFRVNGETGPMNAVALNDAVESLALVRIKEGTISRFTVSITGNKSGARGKVLTLYKNLKVDVLKKGEKGKMEKRGLISWFANTFKLHDEYPGKKTPVAFDASFQRGDKTFFGVLWKTILEGVKQNVGL